MFIPHYGCASEIISCFSLLLFIFLTYVEWGGRKERRKGWKKRERENMRSGGDKEREKWGRKKNFSLFSCTTYFLTPKYPPAQTCVPTPRTWHLYIYFKLNMFTRHLACFAKTVQSHSNWNFCSHPYPLSVELSV